MKDVRKQPAVPAEDDRDFRSFVVQRQPALLRTAWLLTGDWQSAQDLVQAALLRCWPRWDRLHAAGAEAYVRQAMMNLHRSWWRRRWRGETPTAQLPDHPDADVWAATDLSEVLRAALADLPPRQRATVVLRYFDDLTEVQTAAALGCSPGTVKSQTAKALAALRGDRRLTGLLEEVLP